MTLHARRHVFKLVALLLWSLLSIAHADEVELSLTNGISALADYRKGGSDKAAVLVLHGFLQTHQFSTVQRIVNELADNDYSVLAPTLTLRIDLRKKSLTCDAIHSHTAEDSTREIDGWIQWLKRQGHQRIVLIGHSTGSIELLNYLNRVNEPAIAHFIATSIGPNWKSRNPKSTPDDIRRAEALLATTPNKIAKYSLSFCKGNYAAPPAAFLSYIRWTEDYILQHYGKLQVPAQIILGDSDLFLPENWAETLQAQQFDITLIDGANHFFTGTGEFEFLDSVLAAVVRASDRLR